MTTLLVFRDTRHTINELAGMCGVPEGTLRNRLRRGWTLEQAMNTPTPTQRRRGVVSNFAALKGTGAGSTAQEIPEITFSQKATTE
ncbi:MAG: hypothetical protein KL840_14270 [Aquamicrobium sp.]|nr:hypothetical protein [Aquamicrobium sp.]